MWRVLRESKNLDTQRLGYTYFAAILQFLLLQRFSVGLAVEHVFCFISVLNRDLCVCCFGALMSRNPERTSLCMFMDCSRT